MVDVCKIESGSTGTYGLYTKVLSGKNTPQGRHCCNAGHEKATQNFQMSVEGATKRRCQGWQCKDGFSNPAIDAPYASRK